MARSLEQIQEGIEKRITLIKKIQDEITVASQQGNDETMSNAMIRLARVNSALGGDSAEAGHIARMATRAFESMKEGQKTERSRLTLKYSATQAVGKSEHQARVEVAKMVKDIEDAGEISSEAMWIADRARNMSFNTASYLEMARSRLSLIKSDKR